MCVELECYVFNVDGVKEALDLDCGLMNRNRIGKTAVRTLRQ